MNLNIWKKQLIEKLGITDISTFFCLRKEYWNLLEKQIEDLPFKYKLIDPANQQAHQFISQMVKLNEKCYGKGMAAPIWTYANFGTIGAGTTGGFMIDNKLVSKFNVVGDVSNPNISHEWTLLTDPQYQGKGLGCITFALALQVCGFKKEHTFITQTDNPSNLIYLKNPNPLQVLSYGFAHTRKNSLFIKTKIPTNPFVSIVFNKKREYVNTDLAVSKIPYGKKFKIESDNHQLLLKLNSLIQEGGPCYLLDWQKVNNEIYLIFKIIS